MPRPNGLKQYPAARRTKRQAASRTVCGDRRAWQFVRLSGHPTGSQRRAGFSTDGLTATLRGSNRRGAL